MTLEEMHTDVMRTHTDGKLTHKEQRQWPEYLENTLTIAVNFSSSEDGFCYIHTGNAW